jgi:hypothetical protein
MTSFKFKGALAALSLTVFTGAAMAQAPAPSPGAAAWHARAHEMMEQHKAQMAHDLHTILRIRPDQDSAFQAFIGSMAPPPRGEREHKDHAAMETMTTPQRLDHMLAKMDEHMTRMRQHIQATKTFYAALSPEQQQVFDAFMRAHHHGHWGGGQGGGHGHWGGGHGPMGAGPPPPPGE